MIVGTDVRLAPSIELEVYIDLENRGDYIQPAFTRTDSSFA